MNIIQAVKSLLAGRDTLFPTEPATNLPLVAIAIAPRAEQAYLSQRLPLPLL